MLNHHDLFPVRSFVPSIVVPSQNDNAGNDQESLFPVVLESRKHVP